MVVVDVGQANEVGDDEVANCRKLRPNIERSIILNGGNLSAKVGRKCANVLYDHFEAE